MKSSKPSARRLKALQNLAERPGFEHEGTAARNKLAEIRARYKIKVIEQFVSKEALMQKFPKGTRICYNYWAYDPNSTGTVLAMTPKTPDGWIRIKFDHLKNPRAVPAFSELGCHITTEPLHYRDSEDMIYGQIDNFREKMEELKIKISRL